MCLLWCVVVVCVVTGGGRWSLKTEGESNRAWVEGGGKSPPPLYFVSSQAPPASPFRSLPTPNPPISFPTPPPPPPLPPRTHQPPRAAGTLSYPRARRRPCRHSDRGGTTVQEAQTERLTGCVSKGGRDERCYDLPPGARALAQHSRLPETRRAARAYTTSGGGRAERVRTRE